MCKQVRGSQRLRQVFAATLAAGNALNVGTSHTGALGFSVGTLQKLASLKVQCCPASRSGSVCCPDAYAGRLSACMDDTIHIP